MGIGFQRDIPNVPYPGWNDYLQEGVSGTIVEVANRTILMVDGFETTEVNLDQPGTTTKLVKMVSVAHVPRFLRNLLSTRKMVE